MIIIMIFARKHLTADKSWALRKCRFCQFRTSGLWFKLKISTLIISLIRIIRKWSFFLEYPATGLSTVEVSIRVLT